MRRLCKQNNSTKSVVFVKNNRIMAKGVNRKIADKIYLHPVEDAIFSSRSPLYGSSVYVMFFDNKGNVTKASVPKRLKAILKFIGVKHIYTS
jgi:hypothetical protein